MLSNGFMKAWWSHAFFLLLLAACNRAQTGASDQKLEATTESVQRAFVNQSCLKCHTVAKDTNRNVALADINTLIEPEGHVHHHGDPAVRFLVKPGCPKKSFFLSILREGKMPPPPGLKISEEKLQVIEAWITSLKPNAVCEDLEEPPDSPTPGGDEPGGD